MYRINTIELHIPPLRERREDIPDFIDFFVKKFGEETGKKIKSIAPDTLSYLENYDYPGNVRELKNMIERMVILSGSDGVLRAEAETVGASGLSGASAASAESGAETLTGGEHIEMNFREARDEFEKAYIMKALKVEKGNITRAAEAIGLSRRQLFNKITDLGIDANQFSDKD